MKKKIRIIVFAVIFIFPLISYSQDTLIICNSFDTNISYISIDTTGIWEIG